LYVEGDSNVLINNVTIQDKSIMSNTDGIDFSGTNFLIQNCNISDGDDDIVAKPSYAYTSNIYIQNCTITNGHGISIGGQTNAGLNGMFVNNITMNGVTEFGYGIHLKAGDGTTPSTENGGEVQNVTFNNVSITNVDDVITIDSYYENGNQFPNIPGPDGGSAAKIYGLNSSPLDLDGVNFMNINMVTKGAWTMAYAGDVYMNNVTVNGVNLPNSEANVLSGGG